MAPSTTSSTSPFAGSASLPTPNPEDYPQRPRHRRTATGFGSREIKAVQASIPDHLKESWAKFVSDENG